jgi:hypothetical protein
MPSSTLYGSRTRTWIVLREVDHGSNDDLAAALRCQFAASRVAALVVFEQPAAVTRLRARRCMTMRTRSEKFSSIDAFPKREGPLPPWHRLWIQGRRFGHVGLTTTAITDTAFLFHRITPTQRKKKKGMAGPKTPAKQAPATPNASKRAKAPVVASTSSTSSPAATSASKVALDTLWAAYLNTTSPRLKLVDAFLVFLVLSGVIQFVYCVLVTSFPFNAFLAGCVLARFNSLHCD